MAARNLSARPNLEQYKKQAKDLLKSVRAGDPEALRRMRVHHSRVLNPALADAQFVIAREHGFDSWPKFAKQISPPKGADTKVVLWKLAEDAIVAGDVSALERLLRDHRQTFRTERPQSSWLGGLVPDYSPGDARAVIIRNHFFESWEQLPRTPLR